MLTLVTLVYFLCQVPLGIIYIYMTLLETWLSDGVKGLSDVPDEVIQILNIPYTCEPLFITLIYYQTSPQFQMEVKSSLCCPRRGQVSNGEERPQAREGVQLQDL